MTMMAKVDQPTKNPDFDSIVDKTWCDPSAEFSADAPVFPKHGTENLVEDSSSDLEKTELPLEKNLNSESGAGIRIPRPPEEYTPMQPQILTTVLQDWEGIVETINKSDGIFTARLRDLTINEPYPFVCS